MVVAGGRKYHRVDGETGSSHVAEWKALLHALEIAAEFGLKDVQLLGDSKAVIDQANERQKCRSETSLRWREAYRDKVRSFRQVRLRHIKRTQNLAGIELGKMRAAPTLPKGNEGDEQ
jgi:ribonuclease HI